MCVCACVCVCVYCVYVCVLLESSVKELVLKLPLTKNGWSKTEH